MKFPFAKVAVKNLFSKPSTVNFPAVNVDAKPGYRGRIEYYPEKCVNCGMCIRVCSPGAITRTIEPVENGDKITYEFDLTSCTFCATCEDFCSTKAIHLTEDYHMVATDPADLIVRGERVKEKPKGYPKCGDACVFCTLCAKMCPENAIEVDRAEKLWKLDREACVQCGICASKCPKKCITFTGNAK